MRDTIPRRDTTAKRDTIPKKRDSTTITIPIPPRADSLLRDSLAKKDSIAKADSIKKAKGDTVRPPLAHAENPAELTIGRRLHWNRDSLAATGALTLADLLQRVPGFTGLQAGWIAAPALGSYMGDLRRVRVFLDGFEYTSQDQRTQGMLDLTQLNLWAMEDATIEIGADEIRVYLRSWRVHYRASETRTDVSQGDQGTNLYRGFYGKRLSNGMAVQFAAQQYGTTPPTLIGASADQTGVVGRIGWASQQWSIDGFISDISRHRGVILTQPRFTPVDSIPTLNASRADAYVRLGYGDPDASPAWAQAMVVGTKYKYTGIRTHVIAQPVTAEDSAFNNTPLDTNTFRSQYILSLGTVHGPLRLSASERFFVSAGKTLSAPSARGSFVFGPLGVSGFYESKTVDSASHATVSAQLTPLSFISILASAGRTKDDRLPDSSFTVNSLRAEGGLRIHGLWFLGGIMRRDSARLSPPKIFDTSYVAFSEPVATGYTAAIRGKIWKIIGADAWAVRWNDTSGFYRPRYQTRSELYVKTNWLSKFPSGDLGISFSAIHEYRSSVNYPVLLGVGDQSQRFVGTVVAPGYRTISTQLEIRILSATISWQFRNLLGERYTQVPGFEMPHQTNFYGVRWSFVD